MEKNNKSLLISILGGAIACFVCVAMIFIFPSGESSKLKNTSNQLFGGSSSIRGNNVDLDEINLGDTCYSSWQGPTYGEFTCGFPSGQTGTPPDSASGTTWNGIATADQSSCGPSCNKQCYRSTTYTRSVVACSTPAATDNTCEIANCGTYAQPKTSTNCYCQTCGIGYIPSNDYKSCVSATATTPAATDNTCEIANCGTYAQPKTSANCYCQTCGTGYIPSNDYKSCVSATTTPACYCNPINSKCEWRDTNTNSWIKMTNITTQAQCNSYSTDDSSGCFKNSSNKFVWGNYGATEGYTMVSGVTSADTCEALNEGDPEGGTYGLSCPASVVMIGQTIACTYSTSTSATLSSASSSNSGKATVSASGNYVNVRGVAEGSVTVYGITSDGNKTNSVPLLVSAHDVPETCNISISTGSVSVSVATEGEDKNSYYTVNVAVSGKDCGGQTINYSCTNCKNNPPAAAHTIVTGGTSYSTSFKVYPQKACSQSTTTATLTNGNSDTVSIKTNGILTDWTSSDGHCEKSPNYTSFEAADRAGANEYYTNYGTCTSGGSGYRTRWTRGGCGGGSTPTPPPPEYNYCCVNGDKSDFKWYEKQSSIACPSGYTVDNTRTTKDSCSPSTIEKIPHCYLDGNREPHWTSNPETSWRLVDGVTKEEDCKKEEEPACYLSPENEYKWGLYAKKDGYKLITSIITAEECHKPEEGEACYKNADGDYKWAKEAPEGYTKVEDIKTPEDCAPKENPACYLHGNEFKWGYFARTKGYILIKDVTKEEDCKVPDTDACYKAPNGQYVWGKYGNDSRYILVPSVTEPANCKADVPVKPTASNVSSLVYVFMAILMAFGIGFIYYSSVVKKSNR